MARSALPHWGGGGGKIVAASRYPRLLQREPRRGSSSGIGSSPAASDSDQRCARHVFHSGRCRVDDAAASGRGTGRKQWAEPGSAGGARFSATAGGIVL